MPFRRPWIDERESGAVAAVLEVGALGMGGRTIEFETRFAALVGARHAVAVSSCWAAFHLALEALDLAPGDEVLTSVAASIPAIAAIVHVGARPVLVDVMPDTLTLDPVHARSKVTARTRVIMPAHFGGCPAAMDEILALAAEHELKVIEDATDALSAVYQGRAVGSIGDAAIFGLGQDLSITTGEGGVLTTDRAEMAAVCRTRRYLGIPAERAQPAQPPERARYEEPRTYGFGYQISDLNAAVGLQQLRKVEMFHAIRSYYAGLYRLGLCDLPELVLADVPPGATHAWTVYIVRTRRDRLTIGRNTFIRLLARENITAGAQFVPLYAHRYYRDQYDLRATDFPVACAVADEAVSLPIYPRMQEADVWDVIQAVRKIVAAHTTS
ncbi:MAG TPA: DegT/DnrJ/EryC1/StrS family aminotransferase [Candidatus Tectomicrobia bacterium]|nr:DegT/DnrJ/EryC1/StrS family aminotransferase [Candidatus Tectomicrobia bacterium]